MSSHIPLHFVSWLESSIFTFFCLEIPNFIHSFYLTHFTTGTFNQLAYSLYGSSDVFNATVHIILGESLHLISFYYQYYMYSIFLNVIPFQLCARCSWQNMASFSWQCLCASPFFFFVQGTSDLWMPSLFSKMTNSFSGHSWVIMVSLPMFFHFFHVMQILDSGKLRLASWKLWPSPNSGSCIFISKFLKIQNIQEITLSSLQYYMYEIFTSGLHRSYECDIRFVPLDEDYSRHGDPAGGKVCRQG